MMKKNSLNIKIWKYLSIFSIIILLFLWIFQILFLNKFYEIQKTKDIKDVAEKLRVAKDDEDLSKVINKNAYDKNICVEITNKNETLYSSKYLSHGCLMGNEENINYKSDFIYNNYQKMTYKIINPNFKNKTIVYGMKLDNNLYAFVNTSVQPLDHTINILKKQLIYVTIIVLVLSFIIAYFISKKISTPIINITDVANRLAKKDFNVVFSNDEDIKEINDLADSLNYARDELEKTDELRRDLMANVSHDLKTPLTMIKAYAEMARDLNKDNQEKRTQNMNVIIEEVDRLAYLVNDILDLSKIQSDIEDLHYTEFDINELILNILKRYEILKETENYHFIYKNKKKILVTADEKKIEQVIYNLLNNAINYTGDDKKVIINLEEIDDGIRIEIKDTGKGIKNEDIPYIWDRYYKNKKKHKRNLVGTGLGLSIVKEILEKHNYKYGVTSKEGMGTTFYFEIKEKQA